MHMPPSKKTYDVEDGTHVLTTMAHISQSYHMAPNANHRPTHRQCYVRVYRKGCVGGCQSLARHRFAQYKLNHTLGLKKTPRNLIRPTAVSRFMNTCGQTCVSKHTPTTILRAWLRHIHNNEAAPICPSFTIPQGPVNIYV